MQKAMRIVNGTQLANGTQRPDRLKIGYNVGTIQVVHNPFTPGSFGVHTPKRRKAQPKLVLTIPGKCVRRISVHTLAEAKMLLSEWGMTGNVHTKTGRCVGRIGQPKRKPMVHKRAASERYTSAKCDYNRLKKIVVG